MATSRDSIEMRLKLQRAREFQRGVNKSARAVDNLGDQASQAARKMMKLNAASAKTRISLGPFTTSMRFAGIAVGGFMLAVQQAVPLTLSLGEAIVTMGAGAGGAALVGLTAFGQAAVVTSFGLKDLSDALGGNETALKRLGPEARDLFNTLNKAQNTLKVTTNANLFPGLQAGAKSAMRNLPVINKIVGQTATVIGGLGRDAGRMIGSKAWGKDMAVVGHRNTKIIDNLGHAGLHLADAARHIVVEAGPLAEWMSKMILRGSKLTEEWIKNKRQTGELSKFFKRAKTDIRLLASATGHLTGGVLNLFGHQDIDGTNTLRNLDRLTAKFDAWTRSIAGKPLGPELQKQMEKGLAGLASFVGAHLGQAGSVAAGAFWRAFWAADVWGKGITAAFILGKLGLGKSVLGAAGKLILAAFGLGAAGKGGKGGVAGKAAGKLTPIPVYVVNGPGSVIPAVGTAAAGAAAGGALITAGAATLIGLAIAGAVYAALLPKTTPGKTRNLRKKNYLDSTSEHGPPAPPGSYGYTHWNMTPPQSTIDANTRAYRGYSGIPVAPVHVDNHVTIKEPDGRTYRSTVRSTAKRGARKKQRATAVAHAIPGFGSF